MNKVILIGRLTRDPDVRYSQGQNSTCVARCTVAVDRRFKQNGQQDADFPSVIAFGKTGEFIEKYFHKGMKIGIAGRIQTGSYTNRDGVKMYTTDVVAEEVEFVESKSTSQGNNNAAQSTQPPQTSDDGWMNVPDDLEDEGLPFN